MLAARGIEQLGGFFDERAMARVAKRADVARARRFLEMVRRARSARLRADLLFLAGHARRAAYQNHLIARGRRAAAREVA
jgi:hypothetical protein